MKKLLFALILFAAPAWSQISNPGIIIVSTAPSGSCTAALPLQLVFTTGVLYSCQNGAWAAIGSGSGGSLPTATAAGQSMQSTGANSTYAAVPNQNLYLFSVLNNSSGATDGPETWTSTNGKILAQRLSKDNGTDIFLNSTSARDARLLHVGNTYFYSYTGLLASIGYPGIGMVESTDMQNWTPVTTPNWSAYLVGSENAIWNGAWWFDGTNYWEFFGTCLLSGNCTPYYVQFFPPATPGGTPTWGTPQLITFASASPFVYNIVMSVFPSGGTNYALIQGKKSSGQQQVILTSFTSLSSSWAVPNGWVQLGGFTNAYESGAEIPDPVTGFPDVYFVDFNGGGVYLTQANSSNAATATWGAVASLAPYTPLSTVLPADWVDIVPLNDLQSMQNILALRASTLTVSSNGYGALGGPISVAGSRTGPVFNQFEGILPHGDMDYLSGGGLRFTSLGGTTSTNGNIYFYTGTLNQSNYTEVAAVTGNTPVWNLMAQTNITNSATSTSVPLGQWTCPNLTAGAASICYSQQGVSATGNFNLMSLVFGYVGSASTSNYYEWLFGSAAYPVLRAYGNEGVEVGETTPATPPANGLAVGTTGQATIDGSGNGVFATVKAATARKGTFVCTGAGTITISNTNELVTSDVSISLNTAGGTITTPPAVSTVTTGTGFTVLCGATDTSTYNYNIWN